MKPPRPHDPTGGRIPVVEEQATVAATVKETGAVRVRIECEQVEEPCEVESADTEVDIERVRVDAIVDERRPPWIDDGVVVVPIYEEVLVRRLMLREEVRLVRRRRVERERRTLSLRRERAVVERRREDGSWTRVDPVEFEGRARRRAGKERDCDEPKSDVPSPGKERFMRQTVVGIFDQYAAAQHAAKILEDSGFDRDHVHVAASEDESAATDRGTRDEEGVIGRIRHFFSDLLEPDDTEEVGTYAEAVRRGGAVVKVDVDEDEDLDKARETLQQAGAVDIEEKVQEWRASGWTPSSDEPAGRPAESRSRASVAPAEGALPVVREELAVGKRTVGTGAVRVYSRVVEKPVEEAVDLRTERAEVKREAVDRPATQAELEGLRDKTIEVRETTEEPVVQKQARVVEEVSVGKKTDTRQQTVRDKVRNTEVEVEELSGSQARRAFDDYDSDFRKDFDAQYAPSGGRYEEYQPAYRYGYELASDSRYAGREWDDIEADARRDWEAAHPGSAWERFKASIRHAWERVTD